MHPTQVEMLGESVRTYFRDFLLLNERLQLAKQRAKAAAEGVRLDTCWTACCTLLCSQGSPHAHNGHDAVFTL